MLGVTKVKLKEYLADGGTIKSLADSQGFTDSQINSLLADIYQAAYDDAVAAGDTQYAGADGSLQDYDLTAKDIRALVKAGVFDDTGRVRNPTKFSPLYYLYNPSNSKKVILP
jgi:hypothetical protein